MKVRSQRVGGLAALLTASAFMVTGCEESRDSVFLYFINGYPGASSMSIIGPTGVIVQDAKFGDRMTDDGPTGECVSCVPIEVDRSFGSDWTILLEGMPEPAEIAKDLFSMYPQETGTFIVNRRSGEDSVQTSLFRHVQTISSTCGFTMANGLSVTNENMTLSSYTISPEFRVNQVELAGYSDETTVPFLTECGALPLDEPEHLALARTELYPQVVANPFFYPAECQSEQGQAGFCYVWGIPGIDDRSQLSFLTNPGEVLTHRSTFEYYECVQSAIEIQEEEDPANPNPFPIPTDQVECPPGDIEWENVQVDFEAAQACRQPVLRQAIVLEPGREDATLSFVSYYDQRFCDFEFRLRNEGQDIIFGPEDPPDGPPGEHGKGAIITSAIETDEGSEHFWVLLGRPVNPIIWQWDSKDAFVKLTGEAGFPYPNEQDSKIGKYDHPE